MSAHTQDRPNDWRAAYTHVRPQYEDFTRELHRLTCRLLRAEGITISQLQKRTKTVASFVEKLERKNQKYRDPLVEVTDLSGLRVILTSRDDCPKVAELIRREFVVDERNSQPWHVPEELDRFGYRHDHYVVTLSPARCASGEWSQFAEFKAEIQVVFPRFRGHLMAWVERPGQGGSSAQIEAAVSAGVSS